MSKMDIKGVVFVVLFGALLCCVGAGRTKREVGYNKRGGYAGVDYSGGYGSHRIGGHIGYENNNFRVQGSGFYDTQGGWGIGASASWRFKRILQENKGAFVLRVEVDPCQFMLYDRNSDGKVIVDEVREVFPDKTLADNLFNSLDINDDAEVLEDEFEAAKIRVIAGCLPAADEE